MRKIPVGEDFAMVDDDDYALLTVKGWIWHERDGYAVTKVLENNRRRQYSMHRYIMQENNPNVIIDHKDGNRMNNQKHNLRRVTPKQNANNKINNVRIEAFGETKTVAEWVDDDRCKIPYWLLSKRLKEGISPELAILCGKTEL